MMERLEGGGQGQDKMKAGSKALERLQMSHLELDEYERT